MAMSEEERQTLRSTLESRTDAQLYKLLHTTDENTADPAFMHTLVDVMEGRGMVPPTKPAGGDGGPVITGKPIVLIDVQIPFHRLVALYFIFTAASIPAAVLTTLGILFFMGSL